MRSERTPVLHPMALLLGAVTFLICLIFADGIFSLIYLIILWIWAWIGLRWQIQPIFREIRRMWPFLAMTFLLHLVLSGHQSINYEFFSRFDLKQMGWIPATLFTLRLALILSVGVALFQMHPPQRYGREVGRLLGKLRMGRSSWAQSELVVTLALRLVPFLEEEQRRLRMALAARGVEVGQSRLEALKGHSKILFPLILNAFRRADHVSLALEARGWDPRIARTALRHDPMSLKTGITATLFITACLASLAL